MILRAAARPVFVVVAPANTARGYATLRDLQSRLKSIRNIEKITKTMKVVASTKLTRAQRVMVESRAYGQTSERVFTNAETEKAATEGTESVGTAAAEGADGESKDLLVVCSSDKGLCGGVHSGMTRIARRLIAETPDTDVVIIGEKCKAQLGRSNAANIRLSFAGIGKNVPSFADAQAIAEHIVSLPANYGVIKVMYNRFVNASSYEPVVAKAYSTDMFLKSPNIAAFELDDEIAENMREFSLANTLYWALAEGHACEQSARRNAMENASKNAGEMIGRYQIIFNRTRQATITGELIEIIAGSAV